eukprot:EG_transcript_17596
MGGSDAVQKLSPTENTMLGIAAGIIEVTILQPMLYCKNATQQKLPFTLNPRILYRGLAMSITNMAILTGLQFPLTGAVTRVFTRGADRRLSNFEQIASGFIGGCLSGFACAPMELVMIQQQRFGGSLLATPMRIVGTIGAPGMFRGLTMACGREGLFTAGYLGIGPVITRTLQEDYNLSISMAKAGGAVGGGVIAATLSHPMDTCKTCMQGDIERKAYGSLSETAQALYKEAGAGRFFRGWTWRTGRMICAVFIMNECKVQLAPLMFPYHFKS